MYIGIYTKNIGLYMYILYRPIGDIMKKQDYIREYNKETYKTVKVYIREEEYPAVIEHMKANGYNKLSGYVKDLIAKDMEQAGEKQNIHVQNNQGFVISGDNNKGFIVGDVHGDLNL